jgi:peptidyl-prolyl cis-trans isomerase A (cyclophilin A)
MRTLPNGGGTRRRAVVLAACAVLGAGLALAQEATPTPAPAPAAKPPAPAAEKGNMDKSAAKKDVAVIKTNMGTIVFEFLPDVAPKMVENFKDLAKTGFYDGTTFHRVINGFMIQGGGFTKELQQKPVNPPIKNESTNGLKNDNYTVAMARTNVRDSATSQFFINVKDNAFLDKANSRDGNGYTVFGKVVSGMDVVDKIKTVPTESRGPQQNVPVQAVVIKKAKLEK